MQHAVDAKAHAQGALQRLDVDVRSARAHGLLEYRLQQLDDWRVFSTDGQPKQIAKLDRHVAKIGGQFLGQPADFFGTVIDAVDATGRPLYVDLPFKEQAEVLAQDGLSVSRPGRLLNRQSAMADGVGNGTIQGFFGDFTKGAWGAVGGISYRISTEATVTINGELVSLFENNLVAVLAEAEYGFAVQSADYFGKLVTAP